MSRDSDVTLYVEFNNVNKCTYNVKSLSRDITKSPSLFQNSLQPTMIVCISNKNYIYIVYYIL